MLNINNFDINKITLKDNGDIFYDDIPMDDEVNMIKSPLIYIDEIKNNFNKFQLYLNFEENENKEVHNFINFINKIEEKIKELYEKDGFFSIKQEESRFNKESLKFNINPQTMLYTDKYKDGFYINDENKDKFPNNCNIVFYLRCKKIWNMDIKGEDRFGIWWYLVAIDTNGYYTTNTD